MDKIIYDDKFNIILIENDNIDLYNNYKNLLNKLFSLYLEIIMTK